MQIGSFVGKFELIELLGGDISQAYRARDTALDRMVVLKLLDPEASSDPELKARFIEEARAAGALDFGEYQGRPYVVIPARESPKPSILRLSLLVYAIVAFTTVLAVGAWLWMRKAADVPIEPSPRGPAGRRVASMILIPGGTFLAGPDEHPATLKAFYIDATEVTNADFCAIIHCADASAAADLPAVNVTVAQAREYAKYKGERLPTALEWERAARGANGYLYPWGDVANPSLANVYNNPSLAAHALMPVRTFRGYPAYQMVGNAWELVEGPVTPTPEDVAGFANLLRPAPTAKEPWVGVRGGSFREPLTPGVVSSSLAIPERFSAPDIGFRCAKDT
jgi:formylglycine-generating enzyme required for sulfatase activity